MLFDFIGVIINMFPASFITCREVIKLLLIVRPFEFIAECFLFSGKSNTAFAAYPIKYPNAFILLIKAEACFSSTRI
jgi:hypothetical protein